MSRRPSNAPMKSGNGEESKRTPQFNRPLPSRVPFQSGAFKKIHSADLPIISLQSGPNIIEIRNSLINYCLTRDMARISKIFTTGKYDTPAVIIPDDLRLGTDAAGVNLDPHGLYLDSIKASIKHAANEEKEYTKEKERLLGVLLSTTTKELEDKLKTLFATLSADQLDKINTIRGSTTLSPAEIATAIGVLVPTNPADPLQTWVNITYLVTTKASGNKRIDQDATTVSFANLRQRPSESIFDYSARAENVLQAYKLLELVPPSPSTVAMRFTQGLDPTKYGSMQTLFANELHFGRDLYPMDLPSAIANATKYRTNTSRSSDPVYPHAIFGAVKLNPSPKNIRKDQEKNKTRANEKNRPISTLSSNERPKCLYCGRTGHNIIDCFKLLAAQAAAKSDGTPDKKKATLAFKASTLDYYDNEDSSHFSSHVVRIRSTPKTTTQQDTILPTLCATSPLDNSLTLLAKGPTGLLTTDVILDSGANFSIMANPELLLDIRPCQPVTFDGLNGTLSINKKGSLYDICTAYLHTDALANILSFSQVRTLGHTISYDATQDSFTLYPISHPRTYVFQRCPNGLYVANMDSTDQRTVLVTTVKDNEALYPKRDVIKAKAARQLQQRLANPPEACPITRPDHSH